MAFSIVTLQSDLTRIAIAGCLDSSTICSLRPELSGLVRRRPVHVEMELSRLRLIDEGGAQMLLTFFTALSRQGCRLTLRGLHEQPLRRLKTALLDALFGGPKAVN